MTSIILTVTGADIQASVSGPLTSGMVGIPITIEYDDAWNGLTKNLVCRCGLWGVDGCETRTILNVEQTATVAHEVMKASMHLYLGIEGYRGDGTLVMPTTWANCGKIQPGANSDADPSTDPTLPIWNQLQTEIRQISQDAVTQEQVAGIHASAQAASQAAARAGTSAASAAELANTALQAQRAAEAAAERAEAAAKNAETGSGSSQSGNGGSAGWSTEEILLLDTILKSCVTASDQTNNINTLIALLKSNSSGSEGGGAGGGDSGTSYTVTLNLTNVLPSNMAQSVASGSAYMNQLSVGEGYVLGTPVITMGGYDVTSQYYDGAGNISIAAVQGDVVITCKALAVEELTLVPAGSYPDKTTFAYNEATTWSQPYAVAKESATAGGVLSVAWDTDAITGGPGVNVFLFKDGAPYKLASNTQNSDIVEVSDGISTDSYWAAPGSYSKTLLATKPFSLVIPEGCTVMACFRRNGMANDSVTTNATWSAWVGAGNLTVTVTEGE